MRPMSTTFTLRTWSPRDQDPENPGISGRYEWHWFDQYGMENCTNVSSFVLAVLTRPA